jgi:DNA-nicking Smr family endonuclease
MPNFDPELSPEDRALLAEYYNNLKKPRAEVPPSQPTTHLLSQESLLDFINQHSTYTPPESWSNTHIPRERLKKLAKTSTIHTLDLHHLKLYQALHATDSYLNQSQHNDIREIIIIHGVGSGKLRNTVRAYLQINKAVLAYTPIERQRGSNGATCVLLKKRELL